MPCEPPPWLLKALKNALIFRKKRKKTEKACQVVLLLPPLPARPWNAIAQGTDTFSDLLGTDRRDEGDDQASARGPESPGTVEAGMNGGHIGAWTALVWEVRARFGVVFHSHSKGLGYRVR